MPIPKYYEMYSSVLSTLKDFAEHPLADIKATVIQDFRLTEQDLSQMLPSKKQPLWSNRLGWATTYLKHAEAAFKSLKKEFMPSIPVKQSITPFF